MAGQRQQRQSGMNKNTALKATTRSRQGAPLPRALSQLSKVISLLPGEFWSSDADTLGLTKYQARLKLARTRYTSLVDAEKEKDRAVVEVGADMAVSCDCNLISSTPGDPHGAAG